MHRHIYLAPRNRNTLSAATERDLDRAAAEARRADYLRELAWEAETEIQFENLMAQADRPSS